MMKVISHCFFHNPFIKLPLYFTLVELRQVPSMALKRVEIGLVILCGSPVSSLHNHIILYFPHPPLNLFPWLPETRLSDFVRMGCLLFFTDELIIIFSNN